MPAWFAASAFCRSLPACSAYFYCSEALPARGYAKAARGSVRPYWTRYAFKSAFRQFRKQEPRRIDRPRHGRAPMGNGLEAAFRVIGFVADQNDEAMPLVLRLLECTLDQGLPHSAIAKCRLNCDRTKQQRLS